MGALRRSIDKNEKCVLDFILETQTHNVLNATVQHYRDNLTSSCVYKYNLFTSLLN